MSTHVIHPLVRILTFEGLRLRRSATVSLHLDRARRAIADNTSLPRCTKGEDLMCMPAHGLTSAGVACPWSLAEDRGGTRTRL